MKLFLLSATMVAALPAAALAQTTTTDPAMTGQPAATASTAATGMAPAGAPTLAPGTKVYGPQGEEVGTVESVTGGNVVLNTGTNKATLAASSFATGPKGAVIGMTKGQLDAAVQQATSQASAAKDSALVAGAEVRSTDGVVIGKVDKIDGDSVVVARESGPVTLKKTDLTTGAQGGLSLAMTASEFDAAAKAAQGATAPAAKKTKG